MGTGESTEVNPFGSAVGSVTDLPGVYEAWLLADFAELLHIDSKRARVFARGATLARDPLTLAFALADAALDAGHLLGADPEGLRPLTEVVDASVATVLGVTYQRGPMPFGEIEDMLAHILGSVGEVTDSMVELAVTMVQIAFDRLDRLGMLAREGVEPPDWPGGPARTAAAAVTPLGEQWLAVALPDRAPFDIPDAASVAGGTAGQLLEMLDTQTADEGDALVAGVDRSPR